MSNRYARTSTPTITYVADYGAEACFRLHLAGEKGLNALLYRGEITEFLLKQSIRHRLGNAIPGVDLPENPKRADFFLLVERAEAHRFAQAFEVSGIHPYYLGGEA